MSRADTTSDSTEAALAKGRREKPSRNLPTKNLPTNRIAVSKQIEILRAYAASAEPDGRAVTNAEVGEIVGLTANTVSLANAFFTSAGFLERTDNGYIPSAEVQNFYRAYSWNAETAVRKLAPAILRAWFAQAVMPKLRFRPMEESEAITDLAEEAKAGPEYKPNLRMLIEYMEAVALVARENGTIRLLPQSDTESGPATQPPKNEGAAESISDGRPRFATSFSKAGGGLVEFSIDVHVDMMEMSKWTPDRIAQFFKGIALVLAAKNAKELSEIEKESD